MSLFDYKQSIEITSKDYSFYALIMAAIRQADSDNIEKLHTAFPWVYEELLLRYNAPGGLLPDELEKYKMESENYIAPFRALGPKQKTEVVDKDLEKFIKDFGG